MHDACGSTNRMHVRWEFIATFASVRYRHSRGAEARSGTGALALGSGMDPQKPQEPAAHMQVCMQVCTQVFVTRKPVEPVKWAPAEDFILRDFRKASRVDTPRSFYFRSISSTSVKQTA